MLYQTFQPNLIWLFKLSYKWLRIVLKISLLTFQMHIIFTYMCSLFILKCESVSKYFAKDLNINWFMLHTCQTIMGAITGANYVVLRFMKDATIVQNCILKWKMKLILKMFDAFKPTLMIHYIWFTLQILNQVNFTRKWKWT